MVLLAAVHSTPAPIVGGGLISIMRGRAALPHVLCDM
jgi:hypothetical protein